MSATREVYGVESKRPRVQRSGTLSWRSQRLELWSRPGTCSSTRLGTRNLSGSPGASCKWAHLCQLFGRTEFKVYLCCPELTVVETITLSFTFLSTIGVIIQSIFGLAVPNFISLFGFTHCTGDYSSFEVSHIESFHPDML